MAWLSSPLLMPTRMGVPTAPNDTGVDWIIMPSSTAASAGKPMATSKGAAMAAGVPKPEAPSMKAPKHQAMMMAWMRRSGEMLVKPPRMALMAPVCLRVLSIRMAPNTIQSTVTVITNPCRVEAKTRVGLICQPQRAMNTVNRKAMGMARLAGQLRPTSSTAATRIGEKATRASRVSVIIASLSRRGTVGAPCCCFVNRT